MIVSIPVNNRNCEIDLTEPLGLAIPLDFGGAQPNAYKVERAQAAACEAGDLIGDTRRGGSCNFEQVKLIPHCNGTHTECVGHVTHERISVHDCLQDAFVSALLISVVSEKAFETAETYPVELSESDRLITRKSLEDSFANLEKVNSEFGIQNAESLIVRTLPNHAGKLTKTYLEEIPAFFSTEAIRFIVEAGIKHLLVDLPSIDRIFDAGKLSNHRTFWNIEQGSFETNTETRINSTITELIYAPAEISDGAYLLNLQIAPFASDAAPSRPLLFKTNEPRTGAKKKK